MKLAEDTFEMSAPGHHWTPITGVPNDWCETLVDAATAALVDAWLEQAEELRTKDLYHRFLGELKRQWAIETGVIEGIYSISEGATTELIQKGLDASLLSHSDTDLPAAEVIVKIRDNQTAINGLYDFISGNRPLGTSYIKELHQVLTAHQDTYIARDTLGNTVERILPRGEWKLLPNNVEHADGTVFQYCPPEHVASEMDRLIELYFAQESAGVPPDIQAAWIHHRFTLIHPFTDGNGRIARCLATLVLLKSYWLPLVVTRKDRDEYIRALRTADTGDLIALVRLFGILQRRAIRHALSLGESVIDEANALEGVLANIRIKFSNTGNSLAALRGSAIQTAKAIQELMKDVLRRTAESLNISIQDAGQNYSVRLFFGDYESNSSHFNQYQIKECAKQLGYFADFKRYESWAGVKIIAAQHAEILFSLHGIGREHAGVMGASGMIYSKSLDTDGTRQIGDITRLSEEPFEFAYSESTDSVLRRFRKWIEQRLITALDIWQQQI